MSSTLKKASLALENTPPQKSYYRHVRIQKRVFPECPVDQAKRLVFGMIHGAKIPYPTMGQSLVDLDLLPFGS